MAINNWWTQEPYASFLKQNTGKRMSAEFTGAKPDGSVNPMQPIGTMNTTAGPKMLHEGELKLSTQDGQFAVIPSHILGPQALSELERQTKMQGFASGVVSDPPPARFNIMGQRVNTQSGNTVVNNNVGDNTQNDVGANVQNSDNNNEAILSAINAGNNAANMATGAAGRAGVSSNYVGFRLPATQLQPVGGSSPVASVEAPKPTDQEIATNVARNYATGEGPYIQSITNQALQNQGATATAATAALRQEGAMKNMSPEAQSVSNMVRQRDVDAQNSALQGKLAEISQSTQLQAANQLSSMATENFNQNMQLANIQLNSGDYANAAKTLGKAFPGSNVDFTNLVTEANQKKFTNATTQMSTLVSMYPNATTQDIYNMLDKQGYLSDLGLKPEQASSMIRDLQAQSNPITAAAATYSDKAIAEIWPSIKSTQYPALRSELVRLATIGGLSKDGTINTSSINEKDMPMLYSLLGGQDIKEEAISPFKEYTLQAYDAPSKQYMFTDSKGTVVNMPASYVATNPVLNAIVSKSQFTSGLKEAEWEASGDVVHFNKSNTNPSYPHMFTQAGSVWTGEGASIPLVSGQKITLDESFQIEGSRGSIPNGRYVVIDEGPDNHGSKNLFLNSPDQPDRYYPINKRLAGNAGSTAAPDGWEDAKKLGYTWNPAGYYTKEKVKFVPNLK